MAKQKFTHYIPRDKPKKRGPRQHKKNLNKNEKRQKNLLDIRAKDLDKLAVEYNKTKDPSLREEWYRLVRSLDNFQPFHTETSDIILRPPQHLL